MDQALGLRKDLMGDKPWKGTYAEPLSPVNRGVRVMSVSSGKGGVGKSNIVVNLALALDRLGLRVMLMDADLGLANIDLLLGLTPRFNVGHVLAGTKRFSEVLVAGPGNIRILPASSGIQELTKLTDDQKLHFLEMLDEVDVEMDVMLIDTGAGISDTVLYFNLAAQERIIVITQEPTSLTDAYALIKVLYTRHGERHFRIIANGVDDEKSGKMVFSKISKVADHFLDGLSLDFLGSIPKDPFIPQSVLQQKALLELYPQSPSARAFLRMADQIQRQPPRVTPGSIQFFWKRLMNV